MATAKFERLAEILADEHFKSVVDGLRDRFTRIVMAPGTSAEDRASALAEHHALHRLLARMRAPQEESNG